MVITPVRHSTPVRYEYASRYYCTVPASYVREYSRTGTVRTRTARRILCELQYGTSTVQPYKYRQENGPTSKYRTVRCGTVV